MMMMKKKPKIKPEDLKAMFEHNQYSNEVIPFWCSWWYYYEEKSVVEAHLSVHYAI